MKYKLLILDVDGTIVPYVKGALPSPRVTQAIRDAYHKVRVCFATGRPLSMMEAIFDHLKMSGHAILNDGAQVIDIKTKKTLYERAMKKNDLETVVSILQNEGISFFLNDSMHDDIAGKIPPRRKILNIFTMHEMTEEKSDALLARLTHIPTIKVSKTHYGAEESFELLISHQEATKLHGIYEVAKFLRVKKSEIIGIGDSGNDFQLLMACGLKVAMGNAIDDLKAIADYVAPPVEEDGVVDVIEKFILNKNLP